MHQKQVDKSNFGRVCTVSNRITVAVSATHLWY